MIRTGILHVPETDANASEELRGILRRLGAIVVLEEARPSNRNWIADTLRRWSDEEEIDLILTVGGTLPAPGPSAEECVPEATLEVLDRLAPALPETMRAEVGIDQPLALLDRGVAGIRSRTLIVNLPEGDAAALFLVNIAEVIPAYVAHLQANTSAPRLGGLVGGSESDDAVEKSPSETRTGLDPQEFAAFLQRPKQT